MKVRTARLLGATVAVAASLGMSASAQAVMAPPSEWQYDSSAAVPTALRMTIANPGNSPILYFYVILTHKVTSAILLAGTGQTECMPGYMGPNSFECKSNVASGDSVTVKVNTDSGSACTDAFQAYDSYDSSTYQRGPDVTPTAGLCDQSQPPPCKCASLSGFVNDFGVYGNSTRLTFVVNWELTCTAGSGAGCKGDVNLLAPKGLFFVPAGKARAAAKKITRATKTKVGCTGPCGSATTGKKRLTLLAVDLKNPKLSPKGRAGRTLSLVLQTVCRSADGTPAPPVRKVLKIVFRKGGYVDYKKSDLDGDGRPDKGQLKKR
jgi:hypothetical protein